MRQHRFRATIALAAFGAALLACSSAVDEARAAQVKTPRYGFRVLKAFPHDPTAFTQGLVFADGIFYESTGLRGFSTLRKVTPETGNVIQQIPIEEPYFAEGLALVGNELLQLTWEEKTGFVYDKTTLKRLRTFSYPTEGWGMAYDGARLVMSDGSANLFFMDPKTQKITKTLPVKERGRPVLSLNELEWVKGEIWANVWQTDVIARIDPATGNVVGWIDLTGLLSRAARGPEGDVLNGIAWDKAGDRIFVTGKKWPLLFQIELVPLG